MTIFGNSFCLNVEVFGNFLTVKWQFSEGQIYMQALNQLEVVTVYIFCVEIAIQEESPYPKYRFHLTRLVERKGVGPIQNTALVEWLIDELMSSSSGSSYSGTPQIWLLYHRFQFCPN